MRTAWLPRLSTFALLAVVGCTGSGANHPADAAAGTTGGTAGAMAGTAGAMAGTAGAMAGMTGSAGAAPLDAAAGAGGDAADAGHPVDAPTDAHDVSAPLDAGAESSNDTADAAPEVAAAACRTSGTELCEDFESGALDAKRWGQHANGGATISVDGAHTHAGAFALHVKLMAGKQSTAQITDAVTFPAKNNTFYTRAWIYLDPDLPADNMGGFHMAFLLATGNNDLGFVEAGLGAAGDKQYLGYSEYYGAGPDVHAHGPTFTEFGPRSNLRITPKTWICLELLQGGDATTTHRRVWINDTELPEQKNDFSDRKPPAFSLMSIGVLQYHLTPILTDVWFDDVRVSSARIGCGAPPP
jgi:hypothetical protein